MMPQTNLRNSSIASDRVSGVSDIGRQANNRSPSATDSDKENATRQTTRSSLGKRKSMSAAMSSPNPSDSAANKRRRLQEKGKAPASQSARKRDAGGKGDSRFYDPDQDEASKRHTTRRLRELNAELNDSRAEYLQRNSRGLQDTIRQADELIGDVKQTSTATIDSRLLVTVGDLATKKINTLTLGDSSTAIDVDDFLTQCISFMKPDDTSRSQSTQRRRRTQRNNGDADDGEDDEEDQDLELDWVRFGRDLCFPASKRPCLSSFLLGPLSVQKKVRAPTRRRATQRGAPDPALLARPTELDEEALGKKDTYSLTLVCGEIANLLERTENRGEAKVEEEVNQIEAETGRDVSEEELTTIMRKHHVRSNGGVPMFDFCVNPKSFGQTVENFFYISFLVKEGKVGLSHDRDGMPTLSMVKAKTYEERQESVRNQAVFSLSFDIWQEIVDSFGIEQSLIPHREVEDYEQDDGVLKDDLVDRRRSTTASGTARGRASGDTDIESEDLYAA